MESTPPIVGIFVMAGVLAMLVMALLFMVIFNVYKKKLLQKETRLKTIEFEKQIESFKAARKAEDEEREKLARNLHDEILPMLSGLGINLERGYRNFGSERFSKNELMEGVKSVDNIISRVRGISHDLIPPVLLSFGVLKALKEYFNQIGNTGYACADFEDNTHFAGAVPFRIDEQLNIYRLCLELIHNVVKHSGYTYMAMKAHHTANQLLIIIQHDGIVVTNEEMKQKTDTSKGLGLKSIKMRTTLLNGQLNYLSEDGLALITLTIPIPHHEEAN